MVGKVMSLLMEPSGLLIILRWSLKLTVGLGIAG